jgi:hypothetical protein
MGLRCPVYGILADCKKFRFFSFDHRMRTKIAMGCFQYPKYRPGTWTDKSLQLYMSSYEDFIECFRDVCQATFYTLLLGYRNILEALRCKAEEGAKGSGRGEIVGSGKDMCSILGKEEERARLGDAIEKVDEAIRLATGAAEIDPAVNWDEAESMALAGSNALRERSVLYPS